MGYLAPPPPPNSQKCKTKLHWRLLHDKLVVILSLVIHMSALSWGHTSIKNGKLEFDVRAPQDPPNMKWYFFSYFGFERKKFLSDCFRFYMYIDMGGRISGKQDRPSFIIEWPPGPLKYPKTIIFCQDEEEVITSVTGVPMYWDMNNSSQWDICTTNNTIVPFGMGLAGILHYADSPSCIAAIIK